MHVFGDVPPLLGEAGVSIVHSLPRWHANHSLGSVNPNNPQDVTNAEAYAIGVILPIAVCLALAILVWVTCISFCVCRGCCNSCGGRVSNRQDNYPNKSRIILGVIIAIIAAAIAALFGIGIVVRKQEHSEGRHASSDR